MTLRSRIPRGLFSFHFWRLLAFVAILLLGLALTAFAFWRGPEVSTVSAITGDAAEVVYATGMVEIKSGIDEGDPVVSPFRSDLEDGEHLRIKPPDVC